MPDWTPSTILRLRSSVFQMLAETAYFNSSRAPRLQKVYLIPELRLMCPGKSRHEILGKGDLKDAKEIQQRV
jgi:hypothetical protein